MTFRMRQYTTDDEYWRLREFFRRLRMADQRPSQRWDTASFDYWRWHMLENVFERSPEELRYWIDEREQIASVLVKGDPGVCHPMTDPRIETPELVHAMLETAESEGATQARDGRQVVFVWASEIDERLNAVLQARGYVRHESAHAIEHDAWQSLESCPDPVPLADGYKICSMGDVDAWPARSLASWRSFHPDEPDEGADPTGSWYGNVQRAPLYRRDLDVVALAPNGDIASFSLCFFDDVTRTGTFVLVGSAPQHQRKGLAKAVVTEGLRRLHLLGAIGAYVSWYEPEPGALYQSAGFTDFEVARAWKKYL